MGILKSLLNIFKNSEPDWPMLPLPDDSLDYFKTIKLISEEGWMHTNPNKTIYGFQVQSESKWRLGLTEEDLSEFQKRIGINFPECLKCFYRSMNGLTKPGINIYGSNGQAHTYRPIFYSYPEDFSLIEEQIEWIYQANNVNLDILLRDNISRIFPIYGHRFLLVDIPGNPVLSMHGNDVIYWADNLSKCIAVETIDNILNVYDFESRLRDSGTIKFWLDQ